MLPEDEVPPRAENASDNEAGSGCDNDDDDDDDARWSKVRRLADEEEERRRLEDQKRRARRWGRGLTREERDFIVGCAAMIVILVAVSLVARTIERYLQPSVPVPPVAAPATTAAAAAASAPVTILRVLGAEQCTGFTEAATEFVHNAYAALTGRETEWVHAGARWPRATAPSVRGDAVNCSTTAAWSAIPAAARSTVHETCACTVVGPRAVDGCAPINATSDAVAPGTRVVTLARSARMPALPWIRYLLDAASAVPGLLGGGWITVDLFEAVAAALDVCVVVDTYEYAIVRDDVVLAYALHATAPRPVGAPAPASLVGERVCDTLLTARPLECAATGRPTRMVHTPQTGVCTARLADGSLWISFERPT